MKRIVSYLLLIVLVFSSQISHARSVSNSHVDGITYNADGHYWTVYLVATLLNLPNAQELAFYAELPDHVMHKNGDHKRATMTWLNVFMQGKVHALTGKNCEKERERSRKMYENAQTIKNKGRALHRLGDSYAHAKVGDTLMFKRGIGHAFEPEGGHHPDMIRNFPEKYLRYVKDLTYVLGGKDAKIDMTCFEYIAKMKLETADNIEILKTEIFICNKGKEYVISSPQTKVVQAYLDQRSSSCGFSCKMEDMASKKKKKLKTNVILNFAPVEGATH